jgi:CO dehydrogenase/acetyl-CoA synthase beta subunit
VAEEEEEAEEEVEEEEEAEEEADHMGRAGPGRRALSLTTSFIVTRCFGLHICIPNCVQRIATPLLNAQRTPKLILLL